MLLIIPNHFDYRVCKEVLNGLKMLMSLPRTAVHKDLYRLQMNDRRHLQHNTALSEALPKNRD